MSDAPLILGVSGLRGIVGESLTPEVAVRYAGAFGQWIQDQFESWGGVVVARDGRAGGEVIYHAVIAGLRGVGCDVLPIGVAMTPTVGVAVDENGYMGALIVTASHNPQEWNGIKGLVFKHDEDRDGKSVVARAPSGAEAGEIIERFQGQQNWSSAKWLGNEKRTVDAVYQHVFKLRRAMLGKQVSGQLKVVLDSVNTSGAEAAMQYLSTSSLLSERERHQVVQLHGDGSGIFPHTPEPTKENLSGEGGLCDAVPGLKADIGFAQDPDADRLAIVDEKGNYIGEEYTLVLCAMALMEARMSEEAGERRAGSPSHKDQKPVFVVNLSTSRMIDDVAKHYNAEVVRTAVGEANVVEAMKSLKASGRDVVLGGEGNGGVIWSEVTYVRDSLSGMALVLSLMARTCKTVSQLVEMINALGPTDEVKTSGYTIIKKKSALAKKSDADPVVQHLNAIYNQQGDCRVDLQDGIRIDWDARGVWAHVRASNTEPIMRVIVEAPSSEEAEAVAAEIDGQIGAMGNRQ